VSSDIFGIFSDEGPHHWGLDLMIISKSPIHTQYRIPKGHIKIQQKLGLSGPSLMDEGDLQARGGVDTGD
jgi:hypothetical protein